jgi:hypothetical protein
MKDKGSEPRAEPSLLLPFMDWSLQRPVQGENIMKPKPFDPVLGRVPSGIYILTIGTGARATGMLASWVMQAGFDPPMVSIAVKQGRYICDWLSEGQPFVLNVVAEGKKDLLKHFGKGFEPGAPAFEGLPHFPRQSLPRPPYERRSATDGPRSQERCELLKTRAMLSKA